MKAFIMAAGLGTRLRPLTYHLPKPLIPIVNTPTIELLMTNLKKYSIDKVVVNLHYRPDLISSLLENGKKWGVKIHYSYEKKLLGTAGGVKLKEKFFDETFVVTSGDGLSDINFKNVVEFHKKKNALATVVLKPVDIKLDYGLVEINRKQKIVNFYEKPTIGNFISNLINTGIYVFEPEIFKYIPKNRFYDFGSQLLPKLAKMGKPIYGYLMEEYWCDVGNIKEYRKAQHDCLDKNVNVHIPAKEIKKGIWIGKNSEIHKTVKIIPPCLIGNNTRIGKKSVIGNYTIIGNNCIIGENVKINDSILWNSVIVKSNVHLNCCIIASSAVVSESITMFDGTIINIEI